MMWPLLLSIILPLSFSPSLLQPCSPQTPPSTSWMKLSWQKKFMALWGNLKVAWMTSPNGQCPVFLGCVCDWHPVPGLDIFHLNTSRPKDQNSWNRIAVRTRRTSPFPFFEEVHFFLVLLVPPTPCRDVAVVPMTPSFGKLLSPLMTSPKWPMPSLSGMCLWVASGSWSRYFSSKHK